MTGIRQSFVFCRERDGFGTGKAETSSNDYNFVHVAPGNNSASNSFVSLRNQMSKDFWIAPPPGSYFTHTSTRLVKRIQTTGSKFWDAQAYGQLQGTWEWNFVLDHEYLEPFFFAFEESIIGNAQTNSAVASVRAYTYFNVLSTYIMRSYYQFTKINNARVPSFTVMIAIDDQSIKGGPYNEAKVLKGCVVKEVRFVKGSDSSVYEVTMSGFYSDESITYLSGNPISVYKEPVNQGHVEWAAAYLRNTDTQYDYSANVSSVSVSIGNSSQGVYSVSNPLAKNYAEGQTMISMSMTSYYTDPRQYRMMLHTAFGEAPNVTYYPSSKGMAPMSRVFLISSNIYSASAGRGDTPKYPGVFKTTDELVPGDSAQWTKRSSVVGAISPSNSRRYVWFDLRNVAVKSLVWEKGDSGSPLQDKIDGNDCQNMSLCITDYASNYNSTGMFHKILTIDQNTTTFNDTLKTRTNDSGQTRTDWYGIGSDIGALASATKMYNVDSAGATVLTRDFKRLDGWFSPYYYDSIPVTVWGYLWEQTGTDTEDNPVYGWVLHNVTSEYSNPTASGWLYSSHIAETFVAPSASLSTSMSNPLTTGDSVDITPVSDRLGDQILDLNPENDSNLNESLINTDEENNDI